MGCCETRDEKKDPPKIFIRKVSHISMRALNSPSMREQDRLIVTERGNKTFSTKIEGDAISLRQYLTWCRSMKRWDEVVLMLSDLTKTSEPTLCVQWASRATTIGSLAAVFLCVECQKEPRGLVPVIDPALPTFIRTLSMAPEDYQENGMLLLFFYLDAASSKSVRKLVSFGFFSIAMRFLLGTKKEMRLLTAAVCAKAYRGNEFAQKEFLNQNGGFKLLQLVEISRDEKEEVFLGLIEAVIDLVEDENGKIIAKHASRVNNVTVWQLLKSFNKSKLSDESKAKIEHLVNILAMEEQDTAFFS
jgi:hypothetical protein